MEGLKIRVRMLYRDHCACRQHTPEDHAGMRRDTLMNRMQEKGVPTVYLRLGWADV